MTHPPLYPNQSHRRVSPTYKTTRVRSTLPIPLPLSPSSLGPLSVFLFRLLFRHVYAADHRYL